MIRYLICLMVFTGAAQADVVVAARTIPAQTVIAADDLRMRDVDAPGALVDAGLAVGLEARVALFAGRPIRKSDLGTPAVVDRNQVVPLLFESAGLVIKTEGRALDRAGPGELIRVMNLSSRTTVTAMIDASGVAHVAR